ncbi:hypothetical protein SteCoe_30742 [Stentor coeruleus]|uniref:Serine/threonine-protein phosphatase 4 regulatory subunit 3-like central domain-containing protein n=1 Tax=Stentor coeruleus TaxID=5963 RepID=A0A1R2B2X0_9CILI|nr:hypothetical protein SteCoe_30742 [Stentor coeruleus]
MKSRKSIQAAQYSDFLKSNPSLDEVLKNDQTIDEVCCCNPEFSSYITSERVRELIRYITEEPLDPSNTTQACKFPLVASEFFTSDLPCLFKILFQEPILMRYLFSFITREPPINLLLAGYFQKAFESCLNYNTEEFLMIIFQESFHISMLKHLKSSSIADIIYTILSNKGYFDERRILLTETVMLIGSTDLMSSYNANFILCRLNKDDDIYEELLSKEVFEKLLDFVKRKEPYVVRNAGGVVKNILNFSGETVSDHFVKKISGFIDILCLDTDEKCITQFGAEIKCFGEYRLVVLEILVLICNFPPLVSEVSKEISRVIVLLDKYKWSSYFHHAFTGFIEALVNNSSNEYVKALLDADFPQILIENACSSVVQYKKFSTTNGYTGHIYKMINLFVNSKIEAITTSMNLMDVWMSFQKKLDDYNEIESKNIGGKANINFFENLSSEDSGEKAEENDLIPDYPYTKPITGKELEELTDLFDMEDKKPQKNPFMSTKCITNATLEELAANEYLDNVYWKFNVDTCHLDELD